MDERREPLARHDQRAAELGAFRDVLLFAAVFGGVVLINAILGLVLLEVFGTLEAQPTGPAEGAAAVSRRLGSRGRRGRHAYDPGAGGLLRRSVIRHG